MLYIIYIYIFLLLIATTTIDNGNRNSKLSTLNSQLFYSNLTTTPSHHTTQLSNCSISSTIGAAKARLLAGTSCGVNFFTILFSFCNLAFCPVRVYSLRI